MIGGQLINGGWINRSSLSNLVQEKARWASSYQQGTPIRQCRLIQQFIEKPLHISGLLGAATSRRVNFGAQFQFTIWYDNANPVETYGRNIPSWRQRDPFQLVFLLGYDPIKSAYYRAYYAPQAVADTITPIWDEESDPRKCIGEEITGHTRGWTFFLPDDGDPSSSSTLVGAYCSYITGAGKGLI